MKNIFDTVKNNPLFAGIAIGEFENMLGCIEGRTKRYRAGEVLLLAGSTVNFVGIMLHGNVRVMREDSGGNSNIIAEIGAGELFAETFACAGIEHSPVTVQAATDCEVLLINYKKVIGSCSSACVYHTRLVENMLRLLAGKNLLLNQKLEILSKRTTREKLLLYLDTQRADEAKFEIPFTREQLAQYLCVDRSAMSNELCKLRDEGLLRFNKNRFEML